MPIRLTKRQIVKGIALLLLLLALTFCYYKFFAPVEQNIPLSDIPAYSGEATVEINGNVPFFAESEITTRVFEQYSPLDDLGRCGVAYANICRELMPTDKRGDIGSVRPTGWQTVRYDDLVDGGYLYNRCHLIGFQLAGENANAQNLITGTRYLNVVGMLPFEDKVDDYVDDTGNHVLYRVTPIFQGDNLVADGVLMEAYSVEDYGRGVCFCVFAYNVQPGITLDYATGESWLEGQPRPTPTPDIIYVLNKNTMKFHLPDCASIRDIQGSNRSTTTSREEAIADGYAPCGRCKP